MIKQTANVTFGDVKTLENLKNGHPKRNLNLFYETSDNNRFLLLDLSGEANIFNGGLSFIVKKDIDFKVSKDAFFEFRYLTLDEEQQKLFNPLLDGLALKSRPNGLDSSLFLQSVNHDFEFLLINKWNTEENFLVFKTENYLSDFGHDGNKLALIKTYKLFLEKDN